MASSQQNPFGSSYNHSPSLLQQQQQVQQQQQQQPPYNSMPMDLDFNSGMMPQNSLPRLSAQQPYLQQPLSPHQGLPQIPNPSMYDHQQANASPQSHQNSHQLASLDQYGQLNQIPQLNQYHQLPPQSHPYQLSSEQQQQQLPYQLQSPQQHLHNHQLLPQPRQQQPLSSASSLSSSSSSPQHIASSHPHMPTSPTSAIPLSTSSSCSSTTSSHSASSNSSTNTISTTPTNTSSRQRRQYPNHLIERVCRYARQNNAGGTELAQYAREVFNVEVPTSTISNWLSRPENRQPASSSQSNEPEYFLPSPTVIRRRQGTNNQEVTKIILQFVYNCLRNRMDVNTNIVNQYLTSHINITMPVKELKSIFKKYWLTYLIDDYEKGNITYKDMYDQFLLQFGNDNNNGNNVN